ncbi:hypothetical protein Lepto7375DRAFT_3430 [Leptolyngbya sp. PCC 7375]|nr:hypothetical protein Lepto7375DRAFT_3430 [Leptolyngbya sp. PCC 7375]
MIGIDGLQRLVALVAKIKAVQLSPEPSCISQSPPPVYLPECRDAVEQSTQGESETTCQCPEPNAGEPDGYSNSGGGRSVVTPKIRTGLRERKLESNRGKEYGQQAKKLQ